MTKHISALLIATLTICAGNGIASAAVTESGNDTLMNQLESKYGSDDNEISKANQTVYFPIMTDLITNDLIL